MFFVHFWSYVFKWRSSDSLKYLKMATNLRLVSEEG
jgi:S-phase kinase-associated protein 1